MNTSSKNIAASCAFVVPFLKDPFGYNREPMLSEEDIFALLNNKFEFSPSIDTSPMKVYLNGRSKHAHHTRCRSYVTTCVCDQDDIILFLLKNNISFRAVCDYGHTHLIYDKKIEKVMSAMNFGMLIDDVNELPKELENTHHKIMTKNEWIKSNNEFKNQVKVNTIQHKKKGE